jgi:hypothetical protein
MNREREMETEKGSRKWIRGTSEIKQGFTPLLRTVPEHECHIEYLCTLCTSHMAAQVSGLCESVIVMRRII